MDVTEIDYQVGLLLTVRAIKRLSINPGSVDFPGRRSRGRVFEADISYSISILIQPKCVFASLAAIRFAGEIHNITDHFSQAVHWDSFFCHPTSFTRATSVARHFNVKVGSAPVEYFTRWRMLLACDRLKNTDNSVALIANALGYESDTAFGKAFNV